MLPVRHIYVIMPLLQWRLQAYSKQAKKEALQQRYFNRQKVYNITPFGLENFILKKTGCKVGSYQLLTLCSSCGICENGEERHGNILEGEIPYFKIFLKSLQLTKLEIFLVLLFKFVWNLPQGSKKGLWLIMLKHYWDNNCFLFHLSFLATTHLHSSCYISVPFFLEISWDLPSGHCITALLTRDAAHNLTNLLSFLHPSWCIHLCELFIFPKLL